MLQKFTLLAGPDSHTSPDLLVALPLLSDQAMEAWPESVCRAGLLTIHFAAASPGSYPIRAPFLLVALELEGVFL